MPDIDDGYAVFFEDEYRSVVRTAFLIVRNVQRAEDVAQDAFVQLYQHWGKVSRYERPEAWVRRVAIRLAVREVKRTGVREVLQLKSPAPLPVEPLDLAPRRRHTIPTLLSLGGVPASYGPMPRTPRTPLIAPRG